jgi:bacterioferritin-associated ferredoxin
MGSSAVARPDRLILIKGGAAEIAEGTSVLRRGLAMIVWCNVISDCEVRTVAGRTSPGGSTAQIYRGLGREPQCGRCAGSIRKIMDEGSPACSERS